jgi:hypothetical protein
MGADEEARAVMLATISRAMISPKIGGTALPICKFFEHLLPWNI